LYTYSLHAQVPEQLIWLQIDCFLVIALLIPTSMLNVITIPATEI
jgi:hypothetical protein